MIRKAKVEDGDRIAGIEVESSRYAYKDILSEDFLYRDLTVESRTPVHKYWISELLKRRLATFGQHLK